MATEAPNTIAQTEITNAPLRVQSVRDYMLENKLTVHNAVRHNTNGYAYLTFINADNEAENVYFAKTISANFAKDMPVVRGFFDELQIGWTTNEGGEQRVKLIPIGNGTRLETADLF